MDVSRRARAVPGRLGVILRWVAALSVTALSGAAATSCNLIIVGSSDACEADEDCVNFPNTACDKDAGQCVSLDKCQSNAECSGAYTICRHFSPRTCVSLKQGNCQEVYPDDELKWRDDDALILGVTGPLLVGSPDEATGLSIANGAKLGADQFNKDNGVEGDRPVVLVICDDVGDRAPAEENGRTLAAIGAQAMIGPAFSGQTIDTANGTPDPATSADRPGTVENNVLLMSTSATSPLVTGIEDTSPRCLASCGNDPTCQADCPGLVWRTSPSDEIQGKALSAYFANVEGRVKARGGVAPRATLTVYVLYKDDPYGDLLSEVIRTTLKFNMGMDATIQQGTNFFRAVYADVDPVAEGTQPDPAAIATAVAANPDAIFLIGTGEVAGIMTAIETQWAAAGNADADRPFYFLADGGLSGDVSMAGSAFRERVRGSIPGTQGSNFNAFIGDYNQKFPPGARVDGPTVFGAAGAYDAVFLLGYSTVVAGDLPLTSEQLAVGFRSLISGDVINAGSAQIGQAQAALQAGSTINFEGASGSLQFDLVTGEGPSEIQIWCIPSATQLGVFSGLYYDGSQIVGKTDPGDTMSFACPFP